MPPSMRASTFAPIQHGAAAPAAGRRAGRPGQGCRRRAPSTGGRPIESRRGDVMVVGLVQGRRRTRCAVRRRGRPDLARQRGCDVDGHRRASSCWETRSSSTSHFAGRTRPAPNGRRSPTSWAGQPRSPPIAACSSNGRGGCTRGCAPSRPRSSTTTGWSPNRTWSRSVSGARSTWSTVSGRACCHSPRSGRTATRRSRRPRWPTWRGRSSAARGRMPRA